MYNLHCHSLLSDGCLLPTEVAMRYAAAGFKVIAITDHVDYSNIKAVISAILNFTRHWPKNSLIQVLPGIELTHLPPHQFKPLASYARKKGIKVIVAHGESPVEPVVKDTNHLALLADIDILAHPGNISEQDVKLARDRGIFLEITTRRGHRVGNFQVANLAMRYGAKLILGTDSHAPEDIISYDEMRRNALKNGITSQQIEIILDDVKEFLRRKGARC